MISSYRIPSILYHVLSHSARTSLGKGNGVDKESNKNWNRKEAVSQKMMPLTQILLWSFFCNSVFNIFWFFICKKSSFLSFYSFLVKFSGSERVKLTKCESWMGWKMLLCKWHTLWMAPCLICYFILILLYIERPSYEKCSHNLTLEVQIVWKISLF